jgi:cAMP-dependent protein kinase regulator
LLRRDPEKLNEQRKSISVIKKSPDVTARLLEVVSKSALLRTLDHQQKTAIVDAFTGPLVKCANEDIIVQGDIGDVFYLIEEGLVDVFISKNKQPAVKVHTYSAGNSFGELAIMYNAPRAATCRAQTDCKLWALDRISFKVIVVAAAMQKREMYVGFLKQVQILQSLSEMEIMAMADALAEESFPEGTKVCSEGQDGDFFYIVKEGQASCFKTNENGEDVIVATLKSGNYFGEIALLTKKPRQATVKAIGGPLTVLSLDRATFKRVLGPLDEILKRNMELYNTEMAKGI